MFLLYNFLMTILAPVWAPWMIIKSRRRKEAPNWAERQGNYNLERRKDRKRIWVHAVSVGEVMAALPILKELRVLLPDFELLLSVTTSSGHQTARERQATWSTTWSICPSMFPDFSSLRCRGFNLRWLRSWRPSCG